MCGAGTHRKTNGDGDGSPVSSPPEDFTPRSITPSLLLSGRFWKEALWQSWKRAKDLDLSKELF